MITSEMHCEMSRLFVTLEYGEQLAHHCALQQAGWVENIKNRRFLLAQAKQERAHAHFFSMAANRIKLKHHYAPPTALKQFAARLAKTIKQRNLTESIVGSQIVLEGFGGQILHGLNKGLDKNGAGFNKIRNRLLRQEQSHYAFGMHFLETKIKSGETSEAYVCELTNEFLFFVEKITKEMSEIFYVLDENPNEYTRELVNHLPTWLKDGIK